MRHSLVLSAIILTIGSIHPATALAQSTNLTAELYELCRSSPQNSRCKGISTPLSLKDRPGTELDNCAFTFPLLPAKPRNGQCKYELTDNALILYFEQGEPLAILDDRRPTLALKLLPSQIFTLQQYNGFRRGGLLSGRERQMAELGWKLDQPSPSGNQTNYLEIEDSRSDFRYRLATWFNRQNSTTEAIKTPIISPASAPTEPPVASTIAQTIQTLQKTRACVNCDLRGANLQEMDLNGVNLEGAQLSKANLSQAKLEKAYLIGANLQQANLKETQLRDARLAYSDLSNSQLESAELSGANLERANLTKAILRQANLSTSDRRVTWLVGATLMNADLQGAQLRGVNLQQANLTQANLRQANLTGQGFTINLFTNPYNLSSQILLNLSYPTQLNGANLTGANLDQAKLEGTDLSAAIR
jgi:uncharacterized protein YjbI with pentapeptide repeats